LLAPGQRAVLVLHNIVGSSAAELASLPQLSADGTLGRGRPSILLRRRVA
jgi:hypothetical protein